MNFINVCMSIMLFISSFLCADTTVFTTYMHNYQKDHCLNGVILCAQKDKILYEQAFGFADTQKHIANTLETQFLIGSLTKVVTAIAILKLYDEGKINLHAHVSEYLKPDDPVWQGHVPEWASVITIHQLLTHTSGLAEYVTLKGFDNFYGQIHSSSELLQFFMQEPLIFTPGQQFAYSGSGYNVLGKIIEAITNTSYAEFVNNNLFLPLHLKNIVAIHTIMLSEAFNRFPHLSKGYNVAEQCILEPAGEVNLSTAFAEACVISTVADYYQLIHALFEGKILKKNTLELMLHPFVKVDNNVYMGYGLFIEKENHYTLYKHDGRINGYESIMLYNDTKKFYAIILSNALNSHMTDVAYRLLDISDTNKLTNKYWLILFAIIGIGFMTATIYVLKRIKK